MGNFGHYQKGNILLELIQRKTFRCQQMSIIIYCEAVENKPLNLFHHFEGLKVFLKGTPSTYFTSVCPKVKHFQKTRPCQVSCCDFWFT